MKLLRRIWEMIQERSAYTTSFETGLGVVKAVAILRAHTADDRAWILRRLRCDFAGEVRARDFVLSPPLETRARLAHTKAEGTVEEMEGGWTRVNLRVSWAGAVLLNLSCVLFSIPVICAFWSIWVWPVSLALFFLHLLVAIDLFHVPGRLGGWSGDYGRDFYNKAFDLPIYERCLR